MKLHTVDLNLLVAFDVLMSERNVTRAAAKVGLSQSAMSGTLARLRATFDDPLFVRAAGGMTPTPRAEQLIESVRIGLSHLRAALESDADFDPRRSQRIFRVAMNDFAALTLLPPVLESLRARAPQVRLQLQQWATHDLQGVFAVGAELAIGPIIDTSEPCETILEDRFVCMVRRGHPLDRGARLTLAQYTDAEHLLVSATGQQRGAADGRLTKLGLARDVVMTVHNWTIAALLLTSSDYLLSGPHHTAAVLADAHKLSIVSLPEQLRTTLGIQQVWPRRLNEDPGNRWLRDLFAEHGRSVVREAPHRE